MTSVAVIGGGIVGVAIANWLIADGFEVTVLERDPSGRSASAGNASVLALPEITPLARPGVLLSVPKWLMNPLGPLAVRVRDVPSLAPWLLRFIKSARPSHVAQATEALSFLMKTAVNDHIELVRRAGVETYMRRTGALHVYDSEMDLRSAMGEWKERARHGVDYELLDFAEGRSRVPALKGYFARAIFTPEAWMVTNPLMVLEELRAAVRARGAFVTSDVVAVIPESERLEVETADGVQRVFDRVVIAGGVWSRDLVRGLGLSVLLETERGYNTTYAEPGFELPMPIFFAGHGFVASPLADGIRVGGAVELAAVDAPPNFARAAAMRETLRRYVPDLPESGGKEWMGCRPSTPDSLPVIGVHPSDPRISFAFGHGHLGLTLSAVTARHVAGLVAGEVPPPMLSMFGIERFNRNWP